MLNRPAKKRWWFRSGVAALVVLPIPATLAYGCGTPTEYDDLCGWVRDPNNCYRDFFVDVGVSCGAVGQTRIGQFAARDKLDLCILNEGGQVVFEPPIDLALPPPTNPDPITIRMINPDTTLCGEVTFRAKYDFDVSIEGDPIPLDAGDAALPDEFLFGGKFSMVGGKGTDSLAVTCPNEQEYNFDRLQITRCTDLEPILPHAEIDFSAGGIEQTGVIRINVFYPPQEGELEGAQPVPINYVECFIPAAPPLCENGMKDGSETDIDCGGSFCAARCQDAQLCITNDDCASMNCGLDEGIRVCKGP
jgi:hypothetical protein